MFDCLCVCPPQPSRDAALPNPLPPPAKKIYILIFFLGGEGEGISALLPAHIKIFSGLPYAGLKEQNNKIRKQT